MLKFLISRILVLLIAIIVTDACSSQKPVKRQTKELGLKDNVLRYEILPKVKRFCNKKRSEVNTHKFGLETSRDDCPALVKGLEKMQHGVSKHFFIRDSNDHEPKHEKIFDFTCTDSLLIKPTQFNGQLVPPEVKSLYSTPATVYSRHVISRKDLLTAFKDDVNLKKPKNIFMADLAVLDLKFSEKIVTAAYLSVNVEIYGVKLRTTIEPTDEIQKDFKDLPVLTPTTAVDFFRFLSRYGTHLHFGSIFGGKLLVLVSHSKIEAGVSTQEVMDIFTYNALINEVLQMQQGKETKITVYSAGGIPDKKEVHAWQMSVYNDPIPMTYDFMPVHLFLTKGNSTSKSRSLDQMENYERDVNFLKQMYFEVGSFDSINELGRFMQSVMISEIDQICVSEQVVQAVKKGISDGSNVDLSKYYLKCTVNSETKTEIFIEHRMFYVIPGICLTVRTHTNLCDEVDFFLPTGSKCFIFYRNTDCNMHGRFITVRTKENIKSEIGNMRSMRVCHDSEGGK